MSPHSLHSIFHQPKAPRRASPACWRRPPGWRALVGSAVLLLSGSLPGQAQPATGTIEGRVQNVATGTYVNNARVTVEGTTIETFTNQEGEYRLANVAPGLAVVRVAYTGLATQRANRRPAGICSPLTGDPLG